MAPGSSNAFECQLLLASVPFVTLPELVHPTGSIHKLHLSGVERMRCVRDLEFDQWVLVSIGVLDGFF